MMKAEIKRLPLRIKRFESDKQVTDKGKETMRYAFLFLFLVPAISLT